MDRHLLPQAKGRNKDVTPGTAQEMNSNLHLRLLQMFTGPQRSFPAPILFKNPGSTRYPIKYMENWETPHQM